MNKDEKFPWREFSQVCLWGSCLGAGIGVWVGVLVWIINSSQEYIPYATGPLAFGWIGLLISACLWALREYGP